MSVLIRILGIEQVPAEGFQSLGFLSSTTCMESPFVFLVQAGAGTHNTEKNVNMKFVNKKLMAEVNLNFLKW